MSVRRVALLASIAVLLIACADFAAGHIERDSAVSAGQRTQASQRLLTAMLDQETGARGYFETSHAAFLEPWVRGSGDFSAAVAASRRLISGDSGLGGALRTQVARANAWHTTVAAEIRELAQTGIRPTSDQSLADKANFDRFRSANAAYLSDLLARRDVSLSRANWLAAGLVAALTIVLVAAAMLVALHHARRSASRTERQRELRELLQVSGSESESEQLLIRHVQRVALGSAAAVLHRDETDDRLRVALAGPVVDGPLAGVETDELRRRACMAVRLSRPYDRGAEGEPLVACDVCGRVAGEVVCEPLLVGGRVIGSVLVARDRALRPEQRGELRESVVQAAPILANQRTLELAEERAASDSLTGLPNRRSADETLGRMAAHAGRALTPLSALLLDLDRFKQINDRHGHDQGDRALAIIGQVLATTLRSSDFAARYGGEEFLALLPDTDRKSAIEVAEKVRYAVAHADLPVVGPLTCSIGVAALPEDAVDPEQLVRKADRALYTAKARGRNRVEAAAPAGTERLRAPEDDGLLGPGDLLGS